MKKFRKPTKWSIFLKLLLTFLLTSTPLNIVGLVMNDIASQAVRKDIWDSMDSHLHYYLHALETDIGMLIN